MNRGSLLKLLVSMFVLASAFAILILLMTSDAKSHYSPGVHNAIHAIQQSWCGKANRKCTAGNEAISVAKCESAQYWSAGIPHKAVGPNDEYGNPRLSMFQMGTRERRLYGHGPDPWSQARAAHKYYKVRGWKPWTCKP